MDKIAVIMDKEELASSFYEAEYIKVYCNDLNQWKCEKEITVNINKDSGVGAIRQNFSEIIKSLGTCNIIVGREISGIPYNILDKEGFSIFQLEGSPKDFLDAVNELYYSYKSPDSHSGETFDNSMQPIQSDTLGGYRINLIELQLSQPSVSSKKLLLPFLHNTPFSRLEVVCSHVPPWFDTELPHLGLESSVEQLSGNKFIATIYHKTCNEE